MSLERLEQHLEPVARRKSNEKPTKDVFTPMFLASIAVSLKRIADAQDKILEAENAKRQKLESIAAAVRNV